MELLNETKYACNQEFAIFKPASPVAVLFLTQDFHAAIELLRVECVCDASAVLIVHAEACNHDWPQMLLEESWPAARLAC
jgi:hypothetical protein